MRRLCYTVPSEWEGVSLKEFAKKHLGFSTHVLAQQKRVPEGITLNGESVFTTAVLKAGDTLAFLLPQEPVEYPESCLPISVLFENDDFLLIDKPSGMPIHPSPGHDQDSLLNAVAYYYGQRGMRLPICPLYRLDKDTSGVIALGKHTLSVSGTAINKTYFAVCQGTLCGQGTIDVPIGLEEGSKIKRQCGLGQNAVTHWQAVQNEGGHTLVAVRLGTGRTHQIRVHFAHLGHPLAGDDLYGGSLQHIARQALHCGWLSLSSRALGIEQEFAAGFPSDMRAAFPWLPEAGSIKIEI